MKKRSIDLVVEVIDKEIKDLRTLAGLDLKRSVMESLEVLVKEQQAELAEMKSMFSANDKKIKELESVKKYLLTVENGETN